MAYQNTPAYRAGLAKLIHYLEIGKQVAFTCAEVAEKECHRKYTLAAVRELRSQHSCFSA